MSRYLLVLTRDGSERGLSAARLGALTGRLADWVAALRRWRLLSSVAIGAVPQDGPVRGGVLVRATDLDAAQRLAASCPLTAVVLTWTADE
jgi:hypothetical protein